MKKIINKIKSLDKGTLIRTILQILIYINQFVALLGQSTFAKEPVYQWIAFILTIIITVITYWYNNDWTNAAQLTADVFDMLKDGKITATEMKLFIEKHKTEKSNDNCIPNKKE